MDELDRAREYSMRASARGQGVGLGRDYALLPLSQSEEERVFDLPVCRKTKNELQNEDGTFKYAPKKDGSLVGPGRYGIDYWGRFVDLDTNSPVLD